MRGGRNRRTERIHMESRKELQREKREERKKRRIRNQIMVYVVMVFLILAAAAGIVFGVNYLLKERTDTGQNGQQTAQDPPSEVSSEGNQSKEELINDLLADEKEITITPEPTPEDRKSVV